MSIKPLRLAILWFVLVTPVAKGSGTADQSAPEQDDTRQLVTMPDEARRIMRQEMLHYLAALNEIITHLAAGDLTAAAASAETKLGESSMGKHRSTGMRPGGFMPLAMRGIGWSMHESASDLARRAEEGDVKGAYAALQKVTSACVACHYSFRTR